MSKTDRQIRFDYARDLEQLNRPMPTWTRIVLTLVLLGAVLVLADLTLDVLSTNEYPNTWCGDKPPVYGTDC